MDLVSIAVLNFCCKTQPKNLYHFSNTWQVIQNLQTKFQRNQLKYDVIMSLSLVQTFMVGILRNLLKQLTKKLLPE